MPPRIRINNHFVKQFKIKKENAELKKQLHETNQMLHSLSFKVNETHSKVIGTYEAIQIFSYVLAANSIVILFMK